ncbi:MAG: hypothetical protein RLZZ399_2785 [Verrucomicrobiota bacterium]
MSPTPSLLRQDALFRWKEFLPRVAAYARLRNHVSPEHENVSRLSPALRFRTLLEDEIIGETLAEHSFAAGEKWLQEVCWRRYWKGWLEMRPQVWRDWRKRVATLRSTLPATTLARAEAVMSGASGVASMDQIACELIETGYLHNHARMWWASFWIHVEQLPWELGADFFFRHLLDADPASNTLSWRWVAGLQTKGKTYLVRLSNIEKYAPHYLGSGSQGSERLADSAVTTHGPFDSTEYKPCPLPELPIAPPPFQGPCGLWLHHDDLVPEVGPLASLAPASIAACVSEPVYQQRYRLSPRRVASLRTVLADGLSRARNHYRCPTHALESACVASALCSWAKAQGLREVVAFAPMVGPVADTVPRLTALLESQQIRLTLIRRPSDARAFSFAGAGFFPFWQKMSRHLQSPQEVSRF